MRDMTEIELKLMLLRYNMLSRERVTAAYRCFRADEDPWYDAEWSKCAKEMTEMELDLRKRGYKFTYADVKTADGIEYDVYKIVPISK